jgi:7-carboxy-7-deazaguanine synthase
VRLHSIFQSINGEVCNEGQGSICTFIRLQGCNLRCKWCDTKDSQDPTKGSEVSVKEILDAVKAMPVKTENITITGGEPLLQKDVSTLVYHLYKKNYRISIETNGTIVPTQACLEYATLVVDFKPAITPRREPDPMFYEVIKKLRSFDWIKFPVQDKYEFEAAITVKKLIQTRCWSAVDNFAFSAVAPLEHKMLFSWLMEEKQGDVILNVQLHKLIGVS